MFVKTCLRRRKPIFQTGLQDALIIFKSSLETPAGSRLRNESKKYFKDVFQGSLKDRLIMQSLYAASSGWIATTGSYNRTLICICRPAPYIANLGSGLTLIHTCGGREETAHEYINIPQNYHTTDPV